MLLTLSYKLGLEKVAGETSAILALLLFSVVMISNCMHAFTV